MDLLNFDTNWKWRLEEGGAKGGLLVNHIQLEDVLGRNTAEDYLASPRAALLPVPKQLQFLVVHLAAAQLRETHAC